MQEDSRGRTEKRVRNERYGTPSKLLSVSAARKKAEDYSAKNDKPTRVLAKQAILKELNSHLQIRAQGLSLRSKREDDTARQAEDGGALTDQQPRNEAYRAKETGSSKIPGRRIEKGRTKPKKVPPKSAKKTSVSASQDVAQYTWHTGGRLREIKIRFLARKFAHIWVAKVFGRVSPSVARTHHNRSLMQQALRVWQDIWWSGRKGWKLNIRADYHNRFRLWQKAWRAWQEYVSQCRIKKTKERLALHYAHRSQLVRCWAGWREYFKMKEKEKRHAVKADKFAEHLMKRHAWNKWTEHLSFRQELVVMDQTALHFWASNLMAKAWNTWIGAVCYRNEEMEKWMIAVKSADTRLVLKVWRVWKNYRTVRKLKMLKQAAANRSYRATLLRASLNTWYMRWQRQQELSHFEDLIQYKGAIARVRRAFQHWKFYIMMKHNKYVKENLAEEHYRKHLLRTCLVSLHLHVIQGRVKSMRSALAQQMWHQTQLRRVWRVWMKRCEHSEELKLYSLTKKARAHYRVKLLKAKLCDWMKYCQWRRHRNEQYAKADFHFRKTALPRLFGRMMIFVDLMRAKKENTEASQQFRREVLLAKAYYAWWSAYQLQLDVRMMERMAILHHDEVLKGRFLRTWLLKARQELRERKLECAADEHNRHRLLQLGMSRWKEFTVDIKQSRSSHHTAVRRYYSSLFRKAWDAWMKYVKYKQIKWQKQARADVHYQHQVLSKILVSWKGYKDSVSQAKAIVEQKFQLHRTEILRRLLISWCHNSKELKEERLLRHTAKRHWKTSITRKVFSRWREFAVGQAIKQQQRAARVQQIRLILEKGKVFRAFSVWQMFIKRCKTEEGLRLRGECHYRRTVARKTLLSWKTYTQLCFRKKILQRQSMWFHNRRILISFHKKWEEQYEVSVKVKRKTLLALWHWSVVLQRKAFYALLEFAVCRKKRANRIAEAMEQRRTRLLKTGVTQWLKVAFHLAAERTRFARLRHLEVASCTHQSALRCAAHWRQWAARRVRQRGGEPRPKVNRAAAAVLPPPSGVTPADRPRLSTFSTDIESLLPDQHKERPRPRRPDYLRESFDVSAITISTGERAAQPHPQPLSSDEEGLPRPPPPPPSSQPRLHFNPRQRPVGDSSLVFSLSSEGDETYRGGGGDSQGQHRIFPSDRMPVKRIGQSARPLPERAAECPSKLSSRGKTGPGRPILLPPSSFLIPDSPRLKNEPLRGNKVSARVSAAPVDVRSSDSEFSDTDRVSSEAESDDAASNEDGACAEKADLAQILGDQELQRKILSMRDTLQWYHDMKVEYGKLEEERKRLLVSADGKTSNVEDERERDTARLQQLNEELESLSRKIEENRPKMEQVAASVARLIRTTGLHIHTGEGT